MEGILFWQTNWWPVHYSRFCPVISESLYRNQTRMKGSKYWTWMLLHLLKNDLDLNKNLRSAQIITFNERNQNCKYTQLSILNLNQNAVNIYIYIYKYIIYIYIINLLTLSSRKTWSSPSISVTKTCLRWCFFGLRTAFGLQLTHRTLATLLVLGHWNGPLVLNSTSSMPKKKREVCNYISGNVGTWRYPDEICVSDISHHIDQKTL